MFFDVDGLPRVTEVEDRRSAKAASAEKAQALREKANPDKARAQPNLRIESYRIVSNRIESSYRADPSCRFARVLA